MLVLGVDDGSAPRLRRISLWEIAEEEFVDNLFTNLLHFKISANRVPRSAINGIFTAGIFLRLFFSQFL